MVDDHKMTALELAPPVAGAMQKLADDLYWIRFTLPFRLNHINLFAFDTDDGWLVLDCGIKGAATTANGKHCLMGRWLAGLYAALSCRIITPIMLAMLGRLPPAPARRSIWALLNMNRHNGGLGQTDSEYGAMMAAAYQRFGLADNHITAARDTGNYYRFLVGDLPDVIIVTEKAYQFITKAGCWQVRFDAGHSPGHMSLTDSARKLHICVDFLLPRISPNISAIA